MRVEKTIENAKNCLCLKCPSYTTFCKHHNKLNYAVKISKNKYGYDEERKILTLPYYYLFLFIKDLLK